MSIGANSASSSTRTRTPTTTAATVIPILGSANSSGACRKSRASPRRKYSSATDRTSRSISHSAFSASRDCTTPCRSRRLTACTRWPPRSTTCRCARFRSSPTSRSTSGSCSRRRTAIRGCCCSVRRTTRRATASRARRSSASSARSPASSCSTRPTSISPTRRACSASWTASRI